MTVTKLPDYPQITQITQIEKGMFIHWGLYSVVGRHEWVMELEATPSKSMNHWRNNLGRSQMRRARGRPGETRRYEVYGDDYQAP